MGAIREVFGDKIPHIQSTKSLTGHSLGAAGVQESIYGLLMMQEKFIGESAHITELDPEFEGMPIVRKRIDGDPAGPPHFLVLVKWRGLVFGEDATLQRVVDALELPGSWVAFTAPNQRRVARRVRKCAGAPSYRHSQA